MDIWIPGSARREAWLCNLCGRKYPKAQRPQFERHLKKCISSNIGEIDQMMAHRKANVFTSHADEERYRFERDKAVREKRRDVRGIT